jgi:hypothetical protein
VQAGGGARQAAGVDNPHEVANLANVQGCTIVRKPVRAVD